MNGIPDPDHLQLLTRQALRLREELPELFSFLVVRDSQVTSQLRAVPSLADIERAMVFDAGRHLQQMQEESEPGILTLVETKAEPPDPARRHLRLLRLGRESSDPRSIRTGSED